MPTREYVTSVRLSSLYLVVRRQGNRLRVSLAPGITVCDCRPPGKQSISRLHGRDELRRTPSEAGFVRLFRVFGCRLPYSHYDLQSASVKRYIKLFI